jgi:hypothetical protein
LIKNNNKNKIKVIWILRKNSMQCLPFPKKTYLYWIKSGPFGGLFLYLK